MLKWKLQLQRMTGVANMELMEKGTLVKQLEKDLGMARSATPEQVQWRELLEIQRLQTDLADSRLAIQELEEL